MLSLLSFFYLLTTTGTTVNNLTLVYVVYVVVFYLLTTTGTTDNNLFFIYVVYVVYVVVFIY